mgnify:CR=1 FL=1
MSYDGFPLSSEECEGILRLFDRSMLKTVMLPIVPTTMPITTTGPSEHIITSDVFTSDFILDLILEYSTTTEPLTITTTSKTTIDEMTTTTTANEPITTLLTTKPIKPTTVGSAGSATSDTTIAYSTTTARNTEFTQMYHMHTELWYETLSFVRLS